MNVSLKQALLGNSFLKASSLLIAYIFWSILGEGHPSSIWITVPLCFYNTSKNKKITAPETIAIQLKGKRSALYALDWPSLAVHIDVHSLKEGPNSYTLTSSNVLLPNSLVLANYRPSNVVIVISTVDGA